MRFSTAKTAKRDDTARTAKTTKKDTARTARRKDTKNLGFSRGVTLLELLVVMMILGLILTAAVRTWDVTLERGRFETSQRKLDQLVSVIVGNPDYIVSGHRVDFGYIGDVGVLPQNLNDLVRRPAGFPPPEDGGTWRGPYVRSTFQESPDGFRTDGWGDSIVYSPESLFVRSYGGRWLLDPSNWLTRVFGYTREQLLFNEVSGRLLDARGMPPPDALSPGVDYDVELSGPQGGMQQLYPVDFTPGNGQFRIIDVPQGNLYELRAVFRFVRPPLDSVVTTRSVTVYPGTGARDLQVRLNTDWNSPW